MGKLDENKICVENDIFLPPPPMIPGGWSSCNDLEKVRNDVVSIDGDIRKLLLSKGQSISTMDTITVLSARCQVVAGMNYEVTTNYGIITYFIGLPFTDQTPQNLQLISSDSIIPPITTPCMLPPCQDPCSPFYHFGGVQCDGYPLARCQGRADCNGCYAVFLDEYGNEIECIPPSPQPTKIACGSSIDCDTSSGFRCRRDVECRTRTTPNLLCQRVCLLTNVVDGVCSMDSDCSSGYSCIGALCVKYQSLTQN